MDRQTLSLEEARLSRWPRAMLILGVILAVLEGAIRKWLIGSEAGYWSYLTYFSKDIVFGAILLWPAQPARSPVWSTFARFVIFGGGLFVVGAFLSSVRGFNLVGALLTLRAGLLLPVLALLAARRMTGIRLERKAMLLVFLTLANCVVGCVQTRLPPDHVMNRYVLNDSPVTAVEGAVRATGTFSYITGMATLSSVGTWAGMVLLAVGRTRAVQVMGVAGILAGFGCALASVSRGPIVIGCLMLLVWLGVSRAGLTALWQSALVWIACVAVIGGAGLLPQFSELGRALIHRHEAGDDTFGQRAFGQLEEAWEAAGVTPFGAGLGTEQIGGNYAATGTMSFSSYETQFPRIIAETGVFGLAGFVVICIGAIVSLQEASRTAPSKGLKEAAFGTQLLLIPFFYGNVLFNHIASALVWIIFVIMLAVCEAAKPETVNRPARFSQSHQHEGRPTSGAD